MDHDRSYMVCGVGNYYLTYVDFSNLFSRANPLPDLEESTYHGLNGLASLTFELNAQAMALVIDLLNFGLDFNVIASMQQTIDTVVGRLGDGFYRVWYLGAGSLAMLYVAWIGLVKNRYSEAAGALVKTGCVMFLGLYLVGGQALGIANAINTYTTGVTNYAFSALTGIQEDDQSSEALGCTTSEQCVSANIWYRYVYDPWASLQVSANKEIADSERDRILKISNPDDRQSELKDLANEYEDEVKPVVDFVYATGHLLKALFQLLVSAFFAALVLLLVGALVVAEFMLMFFVLTAPIWMVLALWPGALFAEKFVIYTLVEAAQIFGYKILIAINLIVVNSIFANFGTATGYALACALTIVAYIKRKKLLELLSPTAIPRRLEARYRQGAGQGAGQDRSRADAPAPRTSTAGGTGGMTTGTAVAANGARPVRRSFAEARAQMEAGAYSPEAVRSGVASVGAAGAASAAAGAYRGAGAVYGAPTALREDSQARSEEAARLFELADKRAEDPESLTDTERAELERAEAMMSRKNDPLARASLANRGFVSEAKDRRRRRMQRSGLSTGQKLAGPRRDGESERDYLARQKQARKQAEGRRKEISALAEKGEGFRLGKESEGEWPRSVACGRCQKPFMAQGPEEALCPECRGGGPGGGDPGGTATALPPARGPLFDDPRSAAVPDGDQNGLRPRDPRDSAAPSQNVSSGVASGASSREGGASAADDRAAGAAGSGVGRPRSGESLRLPGEAAAAGGVRSLGRPEIDPYVGYGNTYGEPGGRHRRWRSYRWTLAGAASAPDRGAGRVTDR